MTDETRKQIEKDCERHLETFVLDGKGFTRTDIVYVASVMAGRQDTIATNRTVDEIAKLLNDRRDVINSVKHKFPEVMDVAEARINLIDSILSDIEKLKSK